VPVAVLLFSCAIPTVIDGADLKIKTIQHNSGSPVAMNPRLEERIVYLQGNRRRIEDRREQRNPLWPGGLRSRFTNRTAP
jgi:hypothetical protein